MVGQGIHLVIRLVLARLLVPEDFGLMAMAMVVVSFTWWFLDMGFGSALIQRKDLTEAHKSTAFWSNVIIAFLVCLILILVSPLVAQFFRAEALTPVLIVMSLSVALGSPESTLTALLQRDFKFKTIALRKVLGMFLGGITGILLAISGFGVWALVGDSLIRSFSGSLLLFVQSDWKPKFIFSKEAFFELWIFSQPLIGSRLLNFFNRNLDTIIIGRCLGSVPLGLYNIAYQFVLLPLTYVTRSVASVLYPGLSTLQNDEGKFQNLYLKSLQTVVFVTFPMMTVVALASSILIPLILGEKWVPSVPIIPLMCIVGQVQSIQGLMPAVLQAKGKTSLILRYHLFSVIGNSLAFIIGVKWGIHGVAVCYVIVTVAMFPFINNLVLREINLSWCIFLKRISHSFFITLSMTLIWFIIKYFYLKTNNPNYIYMLFFQIINFVIGYLILSWWYNPILKEVEQKFSENKKK